MSTSSQPTDLRLRCHGVGIAAKQSNRPAFSHTVADDEIIHTVFVEVTRYHRKRARLLAGESKIQCVAFRRPLSREAALLPEGGTVCQRSAC